MSSADPLLSPTAASSSSEASPVTLAAMMQMMQALQEQMSKLQRTAARRQTRVVPPTTPLSSLMRVSPTTHSSYQQLDTPAGERVKQSTRFSVGGGSMSTREDDSDDDGDEKETPATANTGRYPMAGDEAHPKDADKLAKIMSKMERPVKFSGEKEKEREEVETWADDVSNYLASQFGVLRGHYPDSEWTLLLSLLTGMARKWVEGDRDVNQWTSWEALKPRFIEFISGGRESRTLHLEQMEALVYGKDKCKDLLSLEREFERLRVKLYPSSSNAPEMNEVVGRWYGDAIKRGDVNLYVEMLRSIGANQQPTLSEWKTAAVHAVRIRELTAATRRAGQFAGTRSGHWGNQGQARTPSVPANEMGGGDDGNDLGDTTDMLTEDAQQIEGRSKSGRPTRNPGKSGFRLSDDAYRRVMDKRLCLQCYKPGHRIGDAACKEKGQKKRMPTEQELKD
jgi:hypothetical protein